MFHEHFLLGLVTQGLVRTRHEDRIGLNYMCFLKFEFGKLFPGTWVTTARKGISMLECLPSKLVALSSSPSTTKNKEKERKSIWFEFSQHHEPLLGLCQCHHGTQPRVKEGPGCVICTTERWTPGNSGCLCLSPFLHLKTLKVHLRDQPVTQATNTCGKNIRA
jgi:hypothetical protein